MRPAFTVRYSNRVNVIKTKVKICEAVDLESFKTSNPLIKEYFATWDTGATNCVINKEVIESLGLKPIVVVRVNHVGGDGVANVYLVNIILPNNVILPGVRVTEGIIEKDAPADTRSHILIGMDVIGLGSFAISNKIGKTTVSFEMPSSEEIDFVPKAREENIEVGGNYDQRRRLKAMQRKKGLGSSSEN